MNPLDVYSLVEREITGDAAFSSPREANWVHRHLVIPPVKRTFEDGAKEGETIDLWVVLAEPSEADPNYQIVFDEEWHQAGDSDCFGLATGRVFLGYYGSFLETFRHM